MDKSCLHKTERLNRKSIIEKLFAGGAKSFSIFPLRVVFTSIDSNYKNIGTTAILISVPKKRFKRAVKRNRVKRQIREAYRKNKHALLHILEEKNLTLAIAFIYLDDKLVSSTEIEENINISLVRIIEKIG
ncbi:Ribonuclease P protein component [termite gut metagenome]|uniref:Ribonuclease P protein component n=1 Tax=termite gut metagenome TaxID=433724 RepID=A0A5J4R701_9ZZZZ